MPHPTAPLMDSRDSVMNDRESLEVLEGISFSTPHPTAQPMDPRDSVMNDRESLEVLEGISFSTPHPTAQPMDPRDSVMNDRKSLEVLEGISLFDAMSCADPLHALRRASRRGTCEEPKIFISHRDGRKEMVHRYTLPWAVCARLSERELHAVERCGPQSWSQSPFLHDQASSPQEEPGVNSSRLAAPSSSLRRSVTKQNHNFSNSSNQVEQSIRRLASSELLPPYRPPAPACTVATEREVQTSAWVEAQSVKPLAAPEDSLYTPKPSQPFCYRPKYAQELDGDSKFAQRSMRLPTFAAPRESAVHAQGYGGSEVAAAAPVVPEAAGSTILKTTDKPSANLSVLSSVQRGEQEIVKDQGEKIKMVVQEDEAKLEMEDNEEEAKEAVSVDHDDLFAWVSIEQIQPPFTLNDIDEAFDSGNEEVEDGDWEMVQADTDESDDGDDELCMPEDEM